MTGPRIASLALLVLMAAVDLQADDKKKVGALGDFDRIEFVGNHVYSADQLRVGLMQDLDVIVAGRPEGDLDLWLRTLSIQIKSGFQYDGYVNANVTSRLNEARDRVVVEISEGPLFHCGTIEITGNKSLPVERFREQLTISRIERKHQAGDSPVSPDLPPSSGEKPGPVWKNGYPARNAVPYLEARHRSVRLIFQSLGYFATKFSLAVRLEDDQSATLIVDIEDEGPRSILDRFEIVGMEKNSTDDVIRFLDLPLGTPLDLGVLAGVERKLWESARFLYYDVQIVPSVAASGSSQSTLKVSLRESTAAWPLFAKLTAEQLAKIQFSRWMSTVQDWKEDIALTSVMTVNPKVRADDPNAERKKWSLAFKLILSPHENALLLHARIAEPQDHVRADWSIQLTPSRFIVDAFPQQLRYETQGFDATHGVDGLSLLNFEWEDAPAGSSDKYGPFRIGAGYRSRSHTDDTPALLRVSLPPALILRAFFTEKHGVQFSDSVATVEFEDGPRILFDRQTGTLDEIVWSTEGDVELKLTCRSGQYREWLADHARLIPEPQRMTSDDAPFSAFTGFLLRCLSESELPEQVPVKELVALGERFLKRGGLQGFDRALTESLEYWRDAMFLTPTIVTSDLIESHPPFMTATLPICRALLPKTEFMQTVAREFVLSRAMRGYRVTPSFKKAFRRDKVGPLTYHAANLAFWLIDRKVIQDDGLGEITAQGIQNDCDRFLSDDWPMGKLLLEAVATWQEADEAEIEALRAVVFWITDGEVDAGSLLQSIPTQKDKSPADIVRSIIVGMFPGAYDGPQKLDREVEEISKDSNLHGR